MQRTVEAAGVWQRLRRLTRLAVFLATGHVLYHGVLAPRHSRWGATTAELAAAWPGDELVPLPGGQSTRAVTVDAPPDALWPWLLQLGQDRGGFYSYDWLESALGLHIHNAEQVVPAWQRLQVGDQVHFMPNRWLGLRTDRVPKTVVALLHPERDLVLHTPDGGGTWSFHLRPIDTAHTRLVARSRAGQPRTVGEHLFNNVLWDIAHFIMERRMLLTLKQRGEHLAHEQAALAELQKLLNGDSGETPNTPRPIR